MDNQILINMIFGVIGGLFIFLLGMKNMSDGMQAIAGDRMRRMINAVTDNRLGACGIGAAITSLIQSSSVTTVMVIGLVNAGLMTLAQAIGVILGADIGTTITAWIVALNIIEYGLPILGISGFFFLFSRNERVRYTAMMIMGVGMIFFGLQLMKQGMEPLQGNPDFLRLFTLFRPDDALGIISCVIIGATVTAIVQSSSATVAITITLARTGALDFATAVALVLGQNIGTTITAYLASLGTSRQAKRAAYAHILIKIVGVVLVVSFFPLYIKFLDALVGDHLEIAKRIALSHTIFNIFIVILFLPSIEYLVKLLMRFVPDRPEEGPPHLTFLDVGMLDAPAIAIQQSFDETVSMSSAVLKMMEWLRETIRDGKRDKQRERKILHREEILDDVQKEIVQFLGHLLSGNVPPTVSVQARVQLRLADEYESISDYLRSICKLLAKMENAHYDISPAGKADILELHDRVNDYLLMLHSALQNGEQNIISRAVADSDMINSLFKKCRRDHITRIEKKSVVPLSSLIFIDILQSYRKVKSHALNIAEALAGEK